MVCTLPCLADVCVIPMGTGSPSVSDEVTLITRLAQQSPLHTVLHSAGTTIEGPWNEVMELIGQFHDALHKSGVVRVQSDVRIGTRTDKTQSPEDKVNIVKKKLAQEQGK